MSDPSTEQEWGERSTANGRRGRTSAGRLLEKMTAADPASLANVAGQLRVDVVILERARDDGTPLDPVVQMMVAAFALELLPDERSLIHQVYGQAQTALRLENGSVESHMTYPKRTWS